MVAKSSKLPRVCSKPTLIDIYSVLIDIERRTHALRILVGKLSPETELRPVKDGVAARVAASRTIPVPKPIVCNACHPVQWPPYPE